MTKLFATTALLTAMAMPAWAVQPAEGETLAENQTYTYWLLDAIKSMDPAKNTDVEGSDVLRSLFEGLINQDGRARLIPGVAETFEASEDGLTYTFNLRESELVQRRPGHRRRFRLCLAARGRPRRPRRNTPGTWN